MVSRASTRARLLDAADELFFTRGVTATPVDAVLERAGVSPATLYRAYGSKEELVAAALERRLGEWLAVWDDAVAAAPDDRSRVLAVFDALEVFHARPTGARWCAFLGAAAEYADPPAVLAAALEADSATLRDRLRDLAGPVVGSRASEVADELSLVVSGCLAMRLRGARPRGTEVARRVADAVLAAAAR
ncbi:helix-turn-helix domain-containing protein [Nocardioides sp. C4-1]|uniref:TetR/AcrR family transcriptional regulator n=1 Tax=Nocardioides sp. C4-1 TaxID=3151851 RepID=UPI003267A640